MLSFTCPVRTTHRLVRVAAQEHDLAAAVAAHSEACRECRELIRVKARKERYARERGCFGHRPRIVRLRAHVETAPAVRQRPLVA